MNTQFKKSSFSNGSGGSNCVEVAKVGDLRMVRRSTNPGVVIGFTEAEWQAFIKGVKNGEFE